MISRTHSTARESKDETASRANGSATGQDYGAFENHNHEHNGNSNTHTHSHHHSIFGHSHTHDQELHAHGAEQIIAAWEGGGDRGSRITLIGLVSNIGLTTAKGIAGWYMHSASLLADAGHSLSDLLGDFVTLFCWKLSRKPPTTRYPYGFAKMETVGTTIVSILLVGGALGIGFHSYHLLIAMLGDTIHALPTGPLRHALENVTSVASSVPLTGHGHFHAVDPNAAWFAALSVLTKEWLYRITKRVADQESSPVLLANAIHHRSDAYSSLVAFCAILGSWLFPSLPLDPLGGLLVSVVILRQGLDLLFEAWADLTDAGVSARVRRQLLRALEPLVTNKSPLAPIDNAPILLGISQLRARRAGSLTYVDLTAVVSGETSIYDASALEAEITQALKNAKKGIAEVRVKFEPRSFAEDHCSS